MENTRNNANLKAIIMLAGTLVALTSGAASAQTSQSGDQLGITSGSVSNTEDLRPSTVNARSAALQSTQSIELTPPGENEGAGNSCGSDSLTQSTDSSFIGDGSVWCGTNTTNDETSLGRAFIAPFDLMLDCVTFGIRENIGGDATVHVRVLVGSPSSAYSDLTLVSETDVAIADDTQFSLVNADIADAQIPAGSQFIVELNTPTRLPELGGDGGLLAFGTNTLGQSSPTYLRGPSCGVEDFADVASFGFGNRNLVMSLGIDHGIAPTIAGGFEMSLLGDAVISTLGDDLVVAGDSTQGEYGVDIAYGDLTGGVGSTFSVLSNGDEVGATVSLGFSGTSSTNSLTFSDYNGNQDEAVLTLDFDDEAFESFDVLVFEDGQYKGTLLNQTSGSVVISQPAGSGQPEALNSRRCGWLCWLFGGSAELHCNITETFEDGELTSRTKEYGASIGATFSMGPSDGGQGLIGNRFAIVSSTLAPPMSDSPTIMDITVSGVQGFSINTSTSAPTVVIGDASTNLVTVCRAKMADKGVAMNPALVGVVDDGIHGRYFATDLNTDGVPDMQILPPVVVPGEDDTTGINMLLGGVESASFEMTLASDVIPCVTLCPWWDTGDFGIQTDGCKISLDRNPFPFANDSFGVQPIFTDVGNGNYTLELYNDGVIQYTASGNNGFAGGSSQMATTLGVLGGDVAGFEVIYPDQTTFTTVDGQAFDVDELHALAEDAPPPNTLAKFTVMASDFNEMVIMNPTTVLPDINVCLADINGDGVLNFFDVSALLVAFEGMDPIADLNGDGVFNFFDISAFLTAFAAGCP